MLRQFHFFLFLFVLKDFSLWIFVLEKLLQVTQDAAAGVITFTLNRPNKGNSLSLLLLQEFKEQLTKIEQAHRKHQSAKQGTCSGYSNHCKSIDLLHLLGFFPLDFGFILQL